MVGRSREKALYIPHKHARDMIWFGPNKVGSLLLQLLWELDNGRSVGLSGVADALLRSQLQHILELLGLKCTKVNQGTHTGMM